MPIPTKAIQTRDALIASNLITTLRLPLTTYDTTATTLLHNNSPAETLYQSRLE